MAESAAELTWRSAGLTDSGKLRELNEDAFLDRPEAGLWAVADGMGGHEAGEVASALTIAGLAAIDFSAPDVNYIALIQTALQHINLELVAEAGRRGGNTTIGCTIAALLTHENHCAFLWAGDSRVYRLRQGVLQTMTRDHSLVEDLVEQGLLLRDDAEDHPDANVITRAVGAAEDLEVDVRFDELCAGDRFLLCSDGLYRELTDSEIGNIMQFGRDCEGISQELLEMALRRRARDNVTVITVEIVSQKPL